MTEKERCGIGAHPKRRSVGFPVHVPSGLRRKGVEPGGISREGENGNPFPLEGALTTQKRNKLRERGATGHRTCLREFTRSD